MAYSATYSEGFEQKPLTRFKSSAKHTHNRRTTEADSYYWIPPRRRRKHVSTSFFQVRTIHMNSADFDEGMTSTDNLKVFIIFTMRLNGGQ